jgi:hypothetical protein
LVSPAPRVCDEDIEAEQNQQKQRKEVKQDEHELEDRTNFKAHAK